MRLVALGLMSGTSLDGVDAALIETDGEEISRRFEGLTLPYAPELRAALRALLERVSMGGGWADDPALEALTLRHVEAVQTLCGRYPELVVDVVGFHGQTLLHAPDRRITVQAGDALLLSRATGLPVVHDFRADDVAAGGQGAPLAPLYHAALLRGHPGPVGVLNLGGVANVTLIGSSGAVHACDTGPGNALLDDWVMRRTGRPYDENGALAAAGIVRDDLVERLLSDPFFALPPPKSLDRLTFARALDAVAGLSAADGAATLAAFTVEAVARTILPERPRCWFVCGGGRRNATLMDGLRARLGVAVEPVEAIGWDGDSLEAECFGFLAVRSLRGLPLSLPGTTGVSSPSTGGRLSCAGPVPPRWMQ
ncbi:anhydro-N-acetylmuramic acid kinase [Acidomonas methanolica]|uniref:Anhydro-N-acetylmuramic acid kinase n=2 Tax=Acidomonas methanolica TaxID=437 RepID=A0A023D495_ACIMT|nr:anhydro-N-acetylmuramic acid kinase [Acidomonas methanolica]MBU2653723.1 anhydro-N-acetylmuramic acid kinase [Acidomonas methanolica]TCS31675.1 anhydro-N-acetylmuramic acid kinase [Acidomonas methanolica]GAJ28889.1 anhydro-N-acetylmuramic acid kinase [Acidomonas methanolica NBRC 104435]GEK98093.1 anhydro-N-acetylmuramic acid kinase [Acidomonas methanolica NBRC 104435]